MPFDGGRVIWWREYHLVEGVPFDGGRVIWWRECHLVEGVPFGGGRVIWWRECHLVEGVSFGGGSAIWWRECHLVEVVSFDGGRVIWWRECHLVEGVPFGGGRVIWWRECHLVEGVSFGGGSAMVWGRICRKERTPLVSVTSMTLGVRLSYHFQQQPRGVIYQHDNDRPHIARFLQNFLRANNVNVLPWPIEHLSNVIDCRVRQYPHLPANQQELIQRELLRVRRDFIRGLTSSMRRRVSACIEASGGHTRY